MKTYKDYLHDFLMTKLGKSNGYRLQAFYLSTQIDFHTKTGLDILTEANLTLTDYISKVYTSPWFETVPRK